jgi:hypothetical protein
MINHVHNMFSTGPETSVTGNTTAPAARDALDSFESALSDAASSTPATYEPDPNAAQVIPASTSSTPVSASTTPASASSTAAASTSTGETPLQELFGGSSATAAPAASSSKTAAATSASTPTPAADPTEAFDNAYWASQPAAVQALRNMPEGEREGYADQLASEGYTIDVPIMVWGWGPSIVTSMRQADGYTWVPSALQSPVEVAPGLGPLGDLAAYNPNDPPPGSIAVPPAGSAAV